MHKKIFAFGIWPTPDAKIDIFSVLFIILVIYYLLLTFPRFEQKKAANTSKNEIYLRTLFLSLKNSRYIPIYICLPLSHYYFLFLSLEIHLSRSLSITLSLSLYISSLCLTFNPSLLFTSFLPYSLSPPFAIFLFFYIS